LDEKNGGPLTALHVSKRGIFRLGFQNLGETLLGALLGQRWALTEAITVITIARVRRDFKG